MDCPDRRANIIKNKVRHLSDHPGTDRIGNCYLDDVAPFEFVDKGHKGLFVIVGGAHSARGLKHGCRAHICALQVYSSNSAPPVCSNAI